MYGRPLPTFLELLGPSGFRTGLKLTVPLTLTLMVTALIAAETALGFVFDPRYKDFPFASLTMAVVSFLGLMVVNRPLEGVGLLFGVVALRIHGRRLAAATRHTVVTAVPQGSVQ